MNDQSHKDRIRQELKEAGATHYALMRAESRYLAQIIHLDEHIGGVVYGRIEGEFSMLVATNKRVLFLQKMALYTTTDELTYDVVSGVKSNDVGLFSSVTLHTRINDYAIRFANTKCVHRFVNYIESRRVENNQNEAKAQTITASGLELNDRKDIDGMNFIKGNSLGVLSTINRTGVINGAAVYYVVDGNDYIYILTRSESAKARGVMSHGQVAFTVHEAGTMKVAQIQGMAEIEQDQTTKAWVFDQIVRPKTIRGETHLPPVTKLESSGSYIIIKITPTNIRYNNYTK